MIKRLRQLARLPASERLHLAEAIALRTLASALLRVLRFRRLAPRLGRHMAESPVQHDAATIEQVARVRWAVGAAARHLPWKPVCMPQAVTALGCCAGAVFRALFTWGPIRLVDMMLMRGSGPEPLL